MLLFKIVLFHVTQTRFACYFDCKMMMFSHSYTAVHDQMWPFGGARWKVHHRYMIVYT